MQKKRNIYLIITLAVLLTTSVSLFLSGRKETQPNINRDYFKLVDGDKIDEVKFTSPRGTIQLKYDGSRWLVNDQWKADDQMIKVLFATLKQVETRRPVANALSDAVTNQLKKTGTLVTLSTAGEKKSEFYAGGNSLKNESWFLKQSDTQPFVMIIPGYRVYVAGVLEQDESGWRDKRIFDLNWRNFKSLTAAYAKEPAAGFEVEMKTRYFGIKNMADADTTKVNDYLDAVSLLFASRFIPKNQPLSDSLKNAKTAVRIEISDIGKRQYSLELFAPGKKDAEIYGRLADGEIISLNKGDVSAIVRTRQYFEVRKQP